MLPEDFLYKDFCSKSVMVIFSEVKSCSYLDIISYMMVSYSALIFNINKFVFFFSVISLMVEIILTADESKVFTNSGQSKCRYLQLTIV